MCLKDYMYRILQNSSVNVGELQYCALNNEPDVQENVLFEKDGKLY